MTVVTLDNSKLAERCRELESQVSAYAPDLVVGVARGGALVAANILASVEHVAVECHRPSTSLKRGFSLFKNILRYLPVKVKDEMRKLEMRMLALRRKAPARQCRPLDEDAARAVSRAQRVLVVDDASDSGGTLQAVEQLLRPLMAADAELRTAVIAETLPATAVLHPHYAVFRNGTLVRFPWSADA